MVLMLMGVWALKNVDKGTMQAAASDILLEGWCYLVSSLEPVHFCPLLPFLPHLLSFQLPPLSLCTATPPPGPSQSSQEHVSPPTGLGTGVGGILVLPSCQEQFSALQSIPSWLQDGVQAPCSTPMGGSHLTRGAHVRRLSAAVLTTHSAWPLPPHPGLSGIRSSLKCPSALVCSKSFPTFPAHALSRI